MDVGGFGKILKMINVGVVDERFRIFKGLIDIYVLKNDEIEINNYVKTEKEGIFRNEKDEVIRAYIQNKQRVEKVNP